MNRITEDRILEQLGRVVDPCMEAAGLGLSLVDLGIVRNVVADQEVIAVELGLTEPGCGFTHALVTRVEDALAQLQDPRPVRVTFDWSEPWDETKMTSTGRTVLADARSRGNALLARFPSKTG